VLLVVESFINSLNRLKIKQLYLVADPPWKYDFFETKNRGIENRYPTMDIEYTKALKVPAAEDNVLF
jgi:hypothetical protein